MRLSRRAAWSAGIAGTALVVCGAAWTVWRASRPRAADPPAARVELPRAVKVEVLNSTRAAGAARTVTELLRHAGLDVVYFGSAADSALRGRVHNEVLVRRGDTTGVGRVREVLGQVTIIDAPDPARMVDLTVLVGADFLQPKAVGRP